MSYYLWALIHLGSGKIRAFSDDVNYIDLHYGGNTLQAKQDDEITDFKNMIACKSHIVSNSTYSWWAAYLSGSHNVYRPDAYFTGGLSGHSTRDLWPYKWLLTKDNITLPLDNLTVIIPVQYDHEHRAENLEVVIRYLKKYFDVRIIVGEVNTTRFRNFCGIEYVRFEMPTFHRTKVLNELTKIAATPYVINYDADVIVPQMQLLGAYMALKAGIDIVYPYTDVFANVPRGMLPKFKKDYDPGCFAGVAWPWMQSGFKSVGGAVGYNKKSFMEAGGENEGFVSYGPEDAERYYRFTQLGLRVEKVPGTIFHFDHWRGPNSGERHPMAKHNIEMWQIIKGMDKKSLEEYIKSDIYGKTIIPQLTNK